jgi:hypothetical protein
LMSVVTRRAVDERRCSVVRRHWLSNANGYAIAASTEGALFVFRQLREQASGLPDSSDMGVGG